jgi:hypothetical protein
MPHFRLAILPLAALSLLSACGGGGHGGSGTSTVASTPTGLSGTVAVGAPITQGKLRILDATGAVVVQDVAINDDGSYPAQTLTGPAPYRIEACGYAGANYTCVYSVAQGAGTANVTPLTSATVLLAAGASPDTLMTGSASGLDASAVDTAQGHLRGSLSAVLTDAGVSSSFDLITGSLSAGSRTGYDRVLDAVGVSTGEDGSHPFVQITPRLGTGNVYIEPGAAAVGSVTVDSGASNLSLAGLETLFQHMSAAMSSASACSNANTGIRNWLASNARMSLGDGAPVTGPDNVAAGLCQFFAQGEDGTTPMWGASLVSPVLGRCDLSGAAPVCRVSFALKAPESEGGGIQALGGGMAVTREGGAWKFMGDADPIQLYASARVQRDIRIDGPTPVVSYARALAFEVPAINGVACASVSQHDSSGAGSVVVAYYKPHDNQARRLSLWTSNSMGNDRSLDPTVGTTRSSDDTWVGLPEGTTGDDVVRNFYRGGRSVTFQLFSDSACSVPFTVDGRSSFEVDVDGVPPVWASLTSLAWPEPDTDTRNALKALTLGAGSSGSFSVAWGSSRSGAGVNGVTVCGDRDCGDGSGGRLGSKDVRPGSTSATVALNNGGNAVTASSTKMIALYGRTGDGMGLQANYVTCPTVTAGDSCH